MPLALIETAPLTSGVHTLGDVQLSPAMRSYLALGASFVETPRRLSARELCDAVTDFFRRLCVRIFFHNRNTNIHTTVPPLYVADRLWLPKLEERDPDWADALNVFIHRHRLPLPRGVPFEWVRDSTTQLDWQTTAPLHMSYIPSNVSRQQSAARDALPANLLIGLADKNMGLTVMEQEWYVQQALRHLSDPAVYTPITPADADLQATADVNWLSQFVHNAVFRQEPGSRTGTAVVTGGKNLAKFLLSKQPPAGRPSDFYILPKLHKQPPGVRPICPLNSYWLTPAHKFVAAALGFLVHSMAWHLLAALEIVNRWEGRRVPAGAIIWTADIQAMYTAIPLDELLEDILANVLDDPCFWWWDQTSLDQPYIQAVPNAPRDRVRTTSLGVWRALLDRVLRSTCLCFRGRFFRQARGVPMGSAAAPVLAVLFVSRFESNFRHDPRHADYWRYIDDLGGIWLASIEELQQRLDSLFQRPDGSAHPTLRLDPAVWRYARDLADNPLPYMDVEIYCERIPNDPNNVILRFRPYTKPGNAHQYVAWQSGHPQHVKLAVVKGEFIRQRRLCSTLQDYMQAAETVFDRFLARGYPAPVIESAATQVLYSGRQACTQKVLRSFQLARLPRAPFWAPPHVHALMHSHRNAALSAAGLQDESNPDSDTTIAVRLRFDPHVSGAIKGIRSDLQNIVNALAAQDKLPYTRVAMAFTSNHSLLGKLRRRLHGTPQ